MDFTGTYRALVVNNVDPEGLARIQVQLPQLMGSSVSGWALPIPAGSTDVPSIGSQVIVAFEGGDLGHPLYYTGAPTVAAQEAADAAQETADLASGKTTMATTNPTSADAVGKPLNAVWDVYSGSSWLRRFVLTSLNPVTWTQVKAGQETLGTDSVGSAQIIDSAVGTPQLADLAVTDAKVADVSVSKLTAPAESAFPDGVVGTLMGQSAFLERLTSGRLMTSAVDNLIPNGNIAAGVVRPWSNQLTLSTDRPAGLPASLVTAAGQGSVPVVNGNESWIDVNPGGTYHFEIWLKANLPNSRLYLELRDQDGTHAIQKVDHPDDGGTSLGGHDPYLVENLVIPTTWTRYSGIVTLTTAAHRVRIGTAYFNHSAGTERGAVVSFAGVRLRSRVNGTLIAPASIDTPHLVANSVTGDKLRITDVTNFAFNVAVEEERAAFPAGSQYSYVGNTPSETGSLSPYVLRLGPGTGYAVSKLGQRFRVTPGERIYVSMKARRSDANVSTRLNLWCMDNSGNTVAFDVYGFTCSSTATNGAWITYEGVATIPAGATMVEPQAKRMTSGTQTGDWYFSDFVIRRMASSELIPAGAVTPDKLSGPGNVFETSLDHVFNGTISPKGGFVTPVMPAGSDFNDYITPGEYYCAANADVGTMANRATRNAGSLVVLKSAGVIQYWHEYNTGGNGRIWRRRQYSGAWSSWELVWTNDPNAIYVGGIAYQRSGHYEASPVSYSNPNYSRAPIYIWTVTKTNPFTPPEGFVFKPHIIESSGYTFVELASGTSTQSVFRLMCINSATVWVRLGWTLVKKP